jgi:hypothetical protein
VDYLIGDIGYFVMGAPCTALGRLQSAQRYLARQLTLLEECFTGLDAYPEIQVEPLEFFYTTARSLGILDANTLRIMLTALTWRGVVWGGWLALMRPETPFVEPLAKALARHGENMWPAQCALALLEGRGLPADLAALNALAARVRESMAVMRIQRSPLRTVPADGEHALLEQQRSLVRAAYKAAGADHALDVLRGTRLHQQSMPYAVWRARQRRTES